MNKKENDEKKAKQNKQNDETIILPLMKMDNKSYKYAEQMFDEIIANGDEIKKEMPLKLTNRTMNKPIHDIMKNYYPDIKAIITHIGYLKKVCEYIDKTNIDPMRASFFPKLNIILNELSGLGDGAQKKISEFRKVFEMKYGDWDIISNQEHRKSEKKRAAIAHKVKNENVRTIKYSFIYEKIREEYARVISKKTTEINKEISSVICIEAATGCRNGEAGSAKIKFEKAADDNMIYQIGRMKSKQNEDKNPFDNSRFEIAKPLLFLTFDELMICKEIVANREKTIMKAFPNIKQEELNKINHLHYNTRSNDRLRKMFTDVRITTHALRAIYARISTKRYLPKGYSEEHYLKQILGHREYIATSYVFNIEFDDDLNNDINLIANVEQAKVDIAQTQNELKKIHTDIVTLKQTEDVDLLENNSEFKYIKLNNHRVLINPKEKNRTMENIALTIKQYLKATGRMPSKVWLRKEALYSGSITMRADKEGLLK
jgi:hypothetical protein